MGIDVISALARMGVNVVVKLHDRSFDGTERGSGGVDWRRGLEQLARDCHVHMAQNADASPYLFVADLLVTDHSSVGFEFMLLDRPIVVIDCPELIEKAHVASDKVRLLRSAAAVISSADELAGAVVRELDNSARLSSCRRAITNDLFYCPGGATERAVRCVYDLLSMGAPDRVAAGASDATARQGIELKPALSGYDSRTT
jgi:hypothetical protein